MAQANLSIEKKVLILSALVEGTPINAICRMFKVGKNSVLDVIAETGEALAAYTSRTFRNLPCERVEMDEQWQYVGKHGQRMEKEEAARGDFWLWCAIDADTKLVITYAVGRRDWNTAEDFVSDVAKRVTGPAQISTDKLRAYAGPVQAYMGEQGASYATELKSYGSASDFIPAEFQSRRKNGIPKIVSAKREAVMGQPNLATATISHIERVFLTMRQELVRFTRLTLAYSKSLRMHKLAVSLNLGIYNLVRKHTTLGTTPAVAAGVESKRWTMEDVVVMTEAYWQPKKAAQKAVKATERRAAQDAVFVEYLAQQNA